MEYTYLILDNTAIADQQLYEIYQLNTLFDYETVYTLSDNTRLLITGPEGKDAFISPIFSTSRKLNKVSVGEIIKIDDPCKSERIVGNLRILIGNGKIELPGAISNVLHYNPEEDSFQYPVDPQLN